MASLFVWIIIIGLIVWSEVRKQKRRQESSRPNVPRGQVTNYGRTPQNTQRASQNYQGTPQNTQRAAQSYQRAPQGYQSVPQRAQGQANPWTQAQQAGAASMAKKQQELKTRLEQRYGKRPPQQGGVQQNMQRREAQRGDILSRANANVRETESDQLAMELSVKHEGGPMTRDAHDLVGAVDITETSDLMRQVNDLMIMGYQADLPPQRDFIAEGVEMLNSYEIPLGV